MLLEEPDHIQAVCWRIAMTRVFVSVCLNSCLSGGGCASADVANEFSWTIQVETAQGFSWWDQISYPVKLSVTSGSAV